MYTLVKKYRTMSFHIDRNSMHNYMKIMPNLLLLLLLLFSHQCSDEPEPVTIYSIGDSTMADKIPEVYPETGWCQVLDGYFNETVTVENHAVNGRSTKSFIAQGRWKNVQEKLDEGDYVFIQFGHNDQKEYDTTRYTDPHGPYIQNLLTFIEDTRAREAIPVLFTPIVRRKLNTSGQIIDTHGEYPDAVRTVALRKQVQLIDLEIMTKEWIESLGETASKEMFVWTGPTEKYPEGRQDDTHLSKKGARKVAEMVVRELKNTNLEFDKRIK